ncbi:aminotransferase class I/II-fold pyridoxal phosphate-dependent enzyme [Kutzneria sp. NPDC052558]|uniref:aminotransferase class I/II-fold pyridoxal phosphate-dependent enzyme n=1 Tax=Kutzneria sp. NPDC052558 TaxID=3364121 RepID=UPI0037C73484
MTHSAGDPSLGSFASLTGRQILDRMRDFEQWRRSHVTRGQWGYHRTMSTAYSQRRPRSHDETSRQSSGVNLISQDYLSLGTHPAIREAIVTTLDTYGPHSAGSPCAAGETALSDELCEQISQLLAMSHVVLFPSGWAAGFGVVQALVRRSDHILVDELSHACVQEGVAASRCRNVTRFRHLDNDAVQSALRRIRGSDATGGILVITESLFSMDSDTPDLAELQKICREFDATLVVDQAHDIGVLGPDGRGNAAAQGMLGQLDLVVGSFSKCLASNGGYIATNSAPVAQYLRYFASTHIFSSALSPLQAAATSAAIRVVLSEDGARRREAVLRNAIRLRTGLSGPCRGIVLGSPSPIVPLQVDSLAAARTALGIAERDGVLTHLVEFPIVPRGQARFRLTVGSGHRADDLDHAARTLARAIDEAFLTEDRRRPEKA